MILEYKPSAHICEGGYFLPFFAGEFIWGAGAHQFLYGLALIYTFFGVAIIADLFMSAIEVITSATKTVSVKDKTGHVRTIEYLVWNETVANLTLMALGSSAPEILLSVIETIGLLNKDVNPGGLGPGTIVGSAAFNLLVIVGVCVSAIPAGETRKIKEMKVFSVTAFYSIFAYVWLYIVVRDNEVKLWEALVTFLGFPVLVAHSFAQEKKWWRGTAQVGATMGDGHVVGTSGMGAKGYGSKEALREKLKALQAAQGLEGLNEAIKNNDMKAFERDAHDLCMLALAEMQADQPMSAIRSKMNARRAMTGRQRVMITKRADTTVLDRLKTADDRVSRRERRRQTVSLQPDVAYVAFAAPSYAVMENAGRIRLTVCRMGNVESKVVVNFRTLDGDALAGEDYVHTNGDVIFEPGVMEQTIEVMLIDDNEYEPDEDFFVELREPKSGPKGKDSEKVKLGDITTAKCTILNDDEPGEFGFSKPTAACTEQDGKVSLTIVREGGCSGEVKVLVSTEDITAVGGADFEALQNKEIIFKHGETEQVLDIKIHEDDEYEKNETFTVSIELPGSPQNGTKYAKHKECLVTIVGDEDMKEIANEIAEMMSTMAANLDLLAGSYKQQLIDAVCCKGEEGGEPETMDYVMHFITIGWKVIFASVPPSHWYGGWPTFFVSLAYIGLLTGFVADIAGIFGCLIGVSDGITAITFVALGTSLPDTFASKTAAVQDKTADASVGNVTGSNSVNVFLGLGLPWLIATVAHTIADYSPLIPAHAGNPKQQQLSSGSFGLVAGSLGFSVIVFCVCGVLCLSGIYARRLTYGYELGGTKAGLYTFCFYSLWLLYVLMSILESNGTISVKF